MKILDTIGKKYNTDKCSYHHNYLNKYQKYLQFSRDAKIKILEIGVLGGSSLNMWSEYFYNSEIIGVDINNECKKYATDKIKIEIGNQSDLNFLKYLVDKYKYFDLIIDDGSHLNEDVLNSFNFLFNYVKAQGMYVVEDVSCSYWQEYGGGLKKNNSIIEYFKNTLDEVNFFGEKIKDNDYIRNDILLLEKFKASHQYHVGFDIESINFLNSLILITKR